MTNYYRTALLVFLFILFNAQTVVANDLPVAADEDKSKENRVDLIGKVLDKNYLDFSPVGKVELPRIIYDADGLHFFRSTSYAINSQSGYTDAAFLEIGEIPTQYAKPKSYRLARIDEEPIIADLSITNHLVFFWLAAFITMGIFIPLASRYKKGVGREVEPKGGFQNLFETFVVFIRDDISKANIGEKYEKFTPYLLTVFFFILFMNLLGLMPWGVSSSADITVTAVLAILTFFMTQIFASKDHWQHVFWFPGVPVPIRFILMPVEIIGLFTKPFSLCIRLFANMASGKILIFALLGLIFIFDGLFGAVVAYGTSWLWILLTLFVYMIKAFIALIQAYVFTILSALFIGMAVAEHHHEEHAH